MDLKATYTKTGRGMREAIKKLPPNAGKVLPIIDKTITGEKAFSKIKKIKKDFEAAISWLLDGGYIKVVATDEFPQSVWQAPSKDAFEISEISFDQFLS